jgi:NTP pyrophosphatase (non-canonical NTP hydrolase)
MADETLLFDSHARLVNPVLEELKRAEAKFPPFNSAHEGWAVLFEEVDELWDAVKMQYGPERDQQMRKEAVQVAAMALRFLLMLEAQK